MNGSVAERWNAWIQSLARVSPPSAGVRYLSQSSGMAQTAIRVLLGGTTPRADAIAWDDWVDSCRDTGPESRPSLLTEYATQSDGQRRAIDRLLAHVDPGEIPAKLAAQNWVGLWQLLADWAADAGVDIGGQSEVIEALRIIRAAERGAEWPDGDTAYASLTATQRGSVARLRVEHLEREEADESGVIPVPVGALVLRVEYSKLVTITNHGTDITDCWMTNELEASRAANRDLLLERFQPGQRLRVTHVIEAAES